MCALFCHLPLPTNTTDQVPLSEKVHFSLAGSMITINSHSVNSPSVKPKEDSRLKLQKQVVFYKIACLCYLLVIILLLTFFIVRAYKSKYRLETDCHISTWIDTVITVLTLTAILLASILLVASFKYVSESENPTYEQPVISLDKTEDFIRRNSQQQQLPVSINRTPSVSSGSWLSAVRSEAYESHRRMSMVPPTSPKCNENTKVSLKPTEP